MSDGIHFEADQRHAEFVAAQLKLDESKSATTSGTLEEQTTSSEIESLFMNPGDARSYRMLVARLNYLALDIHQTSNTPQTELQNKWRTLEGTIGSC